MISFIFYVIFLLDDHFLCATQQELLRLVSSNDEDSYNSNAFYLSNDIQTQPNTPFAAMIAKQQTNYAITDTKQDKRATVTYGIGVPGKDSVKEVSFTAFFNENFLKNIIICKLGEKNGNFAFQLGKQNFKQKKKKVKENCIFA